MMSAPKTVPPKAPVSHDFIENLGPIYDAYLALQASLASDDLTRTNSAYGLLKMNMESVGQKNKDLPEPWISLSRSLESNLPASGEFSSIIAAREVFEAVSVFVLSLEKEFGHTESRMLYEVFCPMAFDNKGAFWLQTNKKVNNPYFGASMLSCGEVTESYSPMSGHHE